MKSNFYQASQENFETIYKYYESTFSKIKNYYKKIEKYIKLTNEYCTKIEQLFNDKNISFDINSTEGFKTIEIDYGNKNIKNKLLTKGEIYEKRIDLSPVLISITKVNQFFMEYVQYLQLFIKGLEIPLSNLNRCIEVTNSEINSVKNNHSTQQKNYYLKFCEFDSLNRNLKTLYMKTETKLVDYCNEKKNKKKKKPDLEEKLNLSLTNAVNSEKEILEKYNSINNFGKAFNDSTNEKINTIKDFTSSLFQKFEDFLNNIFLFFIKSFLKPMEQVLSPKKENNINDEIKLKTEFDELINRYIKKIDEKSINNDLDIYNISIIKKIENDKEEKNEYVNLKKTNSFEIITTDNDSLEEEDIFFVIRNMYEKFKLINKNNYNLTIEENKLEIKKIFNKITSYAKKNTSITEENGWDILEEKSPKIKDKIDENLENNKEVKDPKDSKDIKEIKEYKDIKDKKNEKYEDSKDKKGENVVKDKKNENYEIMKDEKEEKNEIKNINNKDDKNINKDNEISHEEVDYLCQFMNKNIYQRYFLIKINNFRTLGIFEMPLEIFDIIKYIFSEILKNLIIEKDEGQKYIITDLDNGKLIIILSQTFYSLKDGKKIYIYKKN